jgi:hypothetical protein
MFHVKHRHRRKDNAVTSSITATREQYLGINIRVRVDIEDGPVLTAKGYAHRGKAFKAERAHLIYVPVGAQWQMRSFRVHGGVIKKDGTVGKLDAKAEYNQDNAPEWVRQIAEHFRPKQEAPEVADRPVTVVNSDVPRETSTGG